MWSKFMLCESKQIKHNEPPTVKKTTPSEKQKLCGKTFAQEVFSTLHSSPVEEENGSLNLQRTCPPPFLKIENAKKNV